MNILFAEGEYKVNQVDSLGWTALHHAAFLGQSRHMEVLLRHKASIDCKDPQGFTPLALTVHNSHFKATALLLRNGASLTQKINSRSSITDLSRNPKMFTLLSSIHAISAQTLPRIELSTYSSKRNFKNAQTADCSTSLDEQTFISSSTATHDDSEPFMAPRSEKITESTFGSNNNSIVVEESTFAMIRRKATHVAKWQILMIAARILLCYLLELLFEQVKHLVLHVWATYTLAQLYMMLVYDPIRLLRPIFPWLSPLVQPIYQLFETVLVPIYLNWLPTLQSAWNWISPAWNFVVSTLQFIVERCRWIVIPAYRVLVEPITTMIMNIAGLIGEFFLPIFSIMQVMATFGSTFFFWIGSYTWKPFWTVLRPILWTRWSILLSRFQEPFTKYIRPHSIRLMDRTIQTIQPMMNIQGFFSRVFGPLISGLRSILHWFLPTWTIRSVERVSTLIFGEIVIQPVVAHHGNSPAKSKPNLTTTTEETALVLLIVFVLFTYGSVLAWGYIFKVVYGFLLVIDNPLHTHLGQLLDRVGSDGIMDDVGFWLIPDGAHHSIGVLFMLFALVVMLLFNRAVGLQWMAHDDGKMSEATIYPHITRQPNNSESSSYYNSKTCQKA